MKATTKLALLFVLAALATGCPLGPDFSPPEVHAPEEYRGSIPAQEAASIADLPWWQVFQDPVLQDLLNQAVDANYDLRAATARVAQASYLVGVVRSELFPQVGIAGSGSRKQSLIFTARDPQRLTYNLFSGAFNLAWEIDVWGRVRRATEAAEANAEVQVQDQRGLLLMLVAGVAEGYFRLLELDRWHQIATQTEKSFEKSLTLFRNRFEGGVGSELAVARAEASLAEVAAVIPDIEAQIVAIENEINFLLGKPPGPVPRGLSLVEQKFAEETPAGAPSELLRRRPDILLAEQQVRAANAEIGVALTEFFPSIGLTSLYGASNTDIAEMFSGTFSVWNVVGNVSGPLFTGGRNLERYRAQKAAWEATLASYQSVVLQAFREVSDALTLQGKLIEVKREAERAVKAFEKSVELSMLRYELGLADYFEVLQAQQLLYPAQVNLATTQMAQLLVVARLYKVLGGGWNLPTDEWVEPSATPVPDEEATGYVILEVEQEVPARAAQRRSPKLRR